MGTLTTIPKDSTKGFNGLCYVLLANHADVTLSIDASGNTTFSDGDASVGDAFTKFVMTKETSNYTVTGTGTPTAGTTAFNQVLTLVFANNEALKRNAVKVMGNSELVAVAVDRNGEAWCLGNDSCGGLDMTSSTGASGTGGSDLAGQTIVLSGNFPEPESYVDSDELAKIMPS
ncbi:MAG: hypothetical protein R6V17_04720 [Halanaerobacter sp.]